MKDSSQQDFPWPQSNVAVPEDTLRLSCRGCHIADPVSSMVGRFLLVLLVCAGSAQSDGGSSECVLPSRQLMDQQSSRRRARG